MSNDEAGIGRRTNGNAKVNFVDPCTLDGASAAPGQLMTVHCDADFVRQVVLRVFGQSGRKAVGVEGLSEVILINDGKYRGRSYRAEGLLAMWLVDIGLLQVYGREGQMLRTINLFEESGGLQKAA